MKTQYKFLQLTEDNKIKSQSGSAIWKVGVWKKLRGEIDICNKGFHCSPNPYQAFSYVQGEVLAIVETRGKSIKQDDKSCWQEMRLIKAYKWQKKDSVAFAIYAAELVLQNFEKEFPDDKRPREAIEAAKKVLFEDTEENRSAARSAAESARSAARSAAESAWSAAWSAWSAAESAAESARSARSAWSAARSAAESARSAAWSAAESARSAAWSAAESARSAARSAAWSAAESAAWSAAESAIYKQLGDWMENHIKELEEL